MNAETLYIKGVNFFATVLLVIGGIDLCSTAVLGVNPIGNLFGSMSLLSRILYGLIGLAALYEIALGRWTMRRKNCEAGDQISFFDYHY